MLIHSFPTFNGSHMLTLRQVCGMSGVVASKLRQNKVSKRGTKQHWFSFSPAITLQLQGLDLVLNEELITLVSLLHYFRPQL